MLPRDIVWDRPLLSGNFSKFAYFSWPHFRLLVVGAKPQAAGERWNSVPIKQHPRPPGVVKNHRRGMRPTSNQSSNTFFPIEPDHPPAGFSMRLLRRSTELTASRSVL
jgi:hypothetical protein